MIPTRAIGIARDFIAEHEGLSLTPYKDSAGLETIGYGHLVRKYERFDEITEDEAKAILEADMAEAIDCVDSYVDVECTDEQYAAVISFVFNIGCQAFRGSTLLILLNEGHYDLACQQFKRWNKAGGNVVAGLVNRRKAEAELFGMYA